MKVAMVTTAHRHDDVRIYHKEAQTLVGAGWQVEILNPEYEGRDTLGIRFVRIDAGRGRFSRATRGVSAAGEGIRARGVTVAHLHDPELLRLAGELKEEGVRVIYDAHEDLPRSLLTRDWLLAPLRKTAAGLSERMLHRSVGLADGVVAATEEIAATLPGAVLVRNGVTAEDCRLFDRARVMLGRDRQAVCYAGALTRQRGVRVMVEACDIAGARLLLAGEFEDAQLEAEVRAMPSWRCVDYRGRLGREGIARLYAEASAGLLLLEGTPAYRESRPVKLYEYLCAGLPVVASDFARWRGLVEPDTVRFVPPDEPLDIADEIAALLRDPSAIPTARARMPEQRRKFGFSGDAQRLLGLYRQMGGLVH